GAIGRAVCRDLVVNGYLVIGLVRSIEAKERLSYAVIPAIGDIRDTLPWEHSIEQSDIVVHLALHPLESAAGPKEYEDAEREARTIAEILDGVAPLGRRHKELMVHTFGPLLQEPDTDRWVAGDSEDRRGGGLGV